MTTIPLKTPVTVSGETYKAITFREPRAKDLMAPDRFEGETAKGYAMMAAVADVPIAVIQELTIPDLKAVSAAFATVLGNDPTAIGADA